MHARVQVPVTTNHKYYVSSVRKTDMERKIGKEVFSPRGSNPIPVRILYRQWHIHCAGICSVVRSISFTCIAIFFFFRLWGSFFPSVRNGGSSEARTRGKAAAIAEVIA
jgi:hypothetical protein